MFWVICLIEDLEAKQLLVLELFGRFYSLFYIKDLICKL